MKHRLMFLVVLCFVAFGFCLTEVFGQSLTPPPAAAAPATTIVPSTPPPDGSPAGSVQLTDDERPLAENVLLRQELFEEHYKKAMDPLRVEWLTVNSSQTQTEAKLIKAHNLPSGKYHLDAKLGVLAPGPSPRPGAPQESATVPTKTIPMSDAKPGAQVPASKPPAAADHKSQTK